MHTSVARLLTPKERKEEEGKDKAKKKPCILEAHLIPSEALTW